MTTTPDKLLEEMAVKDRFLKDAFGEKIPTLAWVMPVYGSIHRLVYESHMSNMGLLARNGVVCDPRFVIVTNKMGLAGASNAITEAVLKLKVDYVFWTEMDMLLPTDAVSKLLAHALKYKIDVLSGVYFLRGNGQPCLYQKTVTTSDNPYYHTPMSTFPANSIFPVGCPGVGCVLFKREVFEKLQKPYWDDQEGRCGQDMYFYTKLRQAGVKVYADSSVICDQINDDEPRIYGQEDYKKWLYEKGENKHGFIASITTESTIKLEPSET